MIPSHIAKALIFYMKLAETNHDSNAEFLKSSPDMHKYIQDEIKEVINWVEFEPKPSQSKALFGEPHIPKRPFPELKTKGHVPKAPPPSPVFNKKD